MCVNILYIVCVYTKPTTSDKFNKPRSTHWKGMEETRRHPSQYSTAVGVVNTVGVSSRIRGHRVHSYYTRLDSTTLRCAVASGAV